MRKMIAGRPLNKDQKHELKRSKFGLFPKTMT
jgi:hypothetical protein